MGALRVSLVLLVGCRALGQPPRSLSLEGNATLGYYFATALVGSAQQPQKLILDTGSYLTLFGCAGCGHCGSHWTELFDGMRSASFRNLTADEKRPDWNCENGAEGKCVFMQSYAEGSSCSGHFAEDQFIFENETRRDTPELTHIFGCITDEKALFFDQKANGVLGLGVRPRGANSPPTIVEAEHTQQRAPNPQFSLCLAHSGGRLRFGALNTERHLPNARESIIGRKTAPWVYFYAVPITGIAVDHTPLLWNFEGVAARHNQAFFDTGSTFTYFPPELYELWTAAFVDFCAAALERCGGAVGYQQCYAPAAGESAESFLFGFPNVTFTFRDVPFVWFAQDYMMAGSGEFCVGVQPLQDLVLGANFMRNYDFTFDQTSQTVGFVRADCAGTGGVWSSSRARRPTLLAGGAGPALLGALWLLAALG